MTKSECEVESLGPGRIASPLQQRLDVKGETDIRFRNGSERVLVDDRIDHLVAGGMSLEEVPGFVLAGPRRVEKQLPPRRAPRSGS